MRTIDDALRATGLTRYGNDPRKALPVLAEQISGLAVNLAPLAHLENEDIGEPIGGDEADAANDIGIAVEAYNTIWEAIEEQADAARASQAKIIRLDNKRSAEL